MLVRGVLFSRFHGERTNEWNSQTNSLSFTNVAEKKKRKRRPFLLPLLKRLLWEKTDFPHVGLWAETVEIIELRVPPVIRNGTEDFVVLDCIYEFHSREKADLVVRWYFNQDPKPFYQVRLRWTFLSWFFLALTNFASFSGYLISLHRRLVSFLVV